MTITLATLPQATAQEVFNQVRDHLLSQMDKSMLDDGRTCAYRGAQKNMCSAGCLMTDEEAAKIPEKNSWHSLHRDGHVPDEHKDLINVLQNIHDEYYPTQWARGLNDLATEFGLNR